MCWDADMRKVNRMIGKVMNNCPICGYRFQDCQCRFSGTAHSDRSKRARVVADHIYLLTDAQVVHLQKVQEWWQTSYGDEEMNQILNELKEESE